MFSFYIKNSSLKKKNALWGQLRFLSGTVYFKTVSFFFLGFSSMYLLSYSIGISAIDFFKTSISASITSISYKPIYLIHSIADSISSYKNILKERNDLREKVLNLSAQLKEYEIKTSDLAALNKLLTEIDYIKSEPNPARVLGSYYTFPRATLYAMGQKNACLKKDQIALSDGGLIGRVTDVAGQKIKILLLTDYLSRIPVRLQKTGEQAIVAGQGTHELKVIPIDRLQDVLENSELQTNDILVTSGMDDVFPPNIPVARITVIKDGEVFAMPIVNMQILRFINIH